MAKRIKWAENKIRRAVKGCKTKKEFQKKNGSAYKAARRLGIIDDLGFKQVHISLPSPKDEPTRSRGSVDQSTHQNVIQITKIILTCRLACEIINTSGENQAG